MPDQCRHTGRKLPIALLCAALYGAACQAHAQAASDPLPEVIVTAQRSSALASKTPVAMSVLTGDQLAAASLTSPSEIGARLPSVHLDGATDGLRITIRGVSNADTT